MVMSHRLANMLRKRDLLKTIIARTCNPFNHKNLIRMGPIKFLWAYGWNTLYVLAKGRNTCSKRQTRPYQQQGDRQGDDGSEGERSHIYDVCMEEAIERINP